MTETRYAADITITAVDLTEWDLDELRMAVETAVAAWKADVTVSSREYAKET